MSENTANATVNVNVNEYLLGKLETLGSAKMVKMLQSMDMTAEEVAATMNDLMSKLTAKKFMAVKTEHESGCKNALTHLVKQDILPIPPENSGITFVSLWIEGSYKPVEIPNPDYKADQPEDTPDPADGTKTIRTNPKTIMVQVWQWFVPQTAVHIMTKDMAKPKEKPKEKPKDGNGDSNGEKSKTPPKPEGFSSWEGYFKKTYPDEWDAKNKIVNGKKVSYSAVKALRDLNDSEVQKADAANK
ncbi:MAG: hypothetical protein QG591_92 [Planctomycetota bacterium]|nr:hypothetical protein [Planctomycetota bacterium]